MYKIAATESGHFYIYLHNCRIIKCAQTLSQHNSRGTDENLIVNTNTRSYISACASPEITYLYVDTQSNEATVFYLYTPHRDHTLKLKSCGRTKRQQTSTQRKMMKQNSSDCSMLGVWQGGAAISCVSMSFFILKIRENLSRGRKKL